MATTNTKLVHDDSEIDFQQKVEERSDALYKAERHTYYCKIDRLFAAAFFIQWPIAIVMAFLLTPNTWAGAQSATHIHVYMAVGLGGLATLFPAWMVWKQPGTAVTRNVIGASAMIYTTIFTHLAGGIEEAHFHFFMMMAFVSLYFDWRVIVTATLTIGADHLLRTAMFPLSIFGVIDSPWFQFFRHVGWALLEAGVLIYAALIIDKIMRSSAKELAISQLRESKISDLEENERLAAEREAKEQEAMKAIESMRELEERQLTEEKERAEAELVRAKELEDKVNALLDTVGQVAKGNLQAPISVKGDDAIGQVGTALEDLFATLYRNFDGINQRAAMLSKASQELNKTSVVLNRNSSETADQVKRVTDSANQISEGVQSTARSTEQMNNAIRDVSQCAVDAVNVGQEAVTLASEATVTMAKLSESSTGIGNVLKVITSIAEQTNLLALNATIEAARAGDAGKGFAVVANEVKELAKETAKATDEISARISTIQNDAGNAASVIEQIANIIKQIEDFQNSVAASVDEQTATTGEISNTIRIAADESNAIEQHLTEIASKAMHTKESAVAVDNSATTLSAIANQLSELISIYQTQDRSR